MKIGQSAKIALPVLLCVFFATGYAQNYPFTWKITSDPWFMPKSYAFKTTSNEFTTKGNPTSVHGPVCTHACRETTEPDACTSNLIREKCREVVLPDVAFPDGYSGVEYVTFVVRTNGHVGTYQVVKQPVLCKPCIQAAVNLVATLGEWHPAIEDGIFVESTVVVPVYFKMNAARR